VHLGCAALKANSVQCQSNLKQLAIATMMYSQDNDERMPPSASWAEAIAPRVPAAWRSAMDSSADPFHCPAAESPASYGMNAALGGISESCIDAPAETVLLFDADAPRRSFAGGDAVVAWTRHAGGPNIAFAEGHVRFANPYLRARLRWSPGATARERVWLL
jgi:prepilin-type processing-associated H-X9-DG protein